MDKKKGQPVVAVIKRDHFPHCCRRSKVGCAQSAVGVTHQALLSASAVNQAIIDSASAQTHAIYFMDSLQITEAMLPPPHLSWNKVLATLEEGAREEVISTLTDNEAINASSDWFLQARREQ